MKKIVFQKKNFAKKVYSSLESFNIIFILTIVLSISSCTPETLSSADVIRSEASVSNQKMYVIERDVPGAGNFTAEDLKEISQKSCAVLDKMGSEIKWLHSYVTNDKIYCVYTAPNEEMVREHAKQGGFPANSVAIVATVIDPSTAY